MMKRLIGTAGALLFAAQGAFADHHLPQVQALETYACNFAEGKDLDDFLAVAEKWDRFADDGFSEPYEGFVLTPFYFNAETNADVYWVGVSPNFAAQGTTADEWMAKGAALQKAFDQVAPCQSHSQMASISVRDINRSTGVVDFSACSLKPGATPEAISAADKKMVEFLEKVGSSTAIYRWYPVQGTANAPIDFLQVNADGSNSEAGANKDKFLKGGGIAVQRALYGDLMTCRNGPSAHFQSVGGSD
jgi:hypothetical protein